MRKLCKILRKTWAAYQPHLIPDYIPKILPQTAYPSKFAFRLQRGSKWKKSAVFEIFSFFRNNSTKIVRVIIMAKIADFVHFEPLWSLNANFAGHPVRYIV